MNLEKNQFRLEPGTYEHYKINSDGTHPIYVVENIMTHIQQEGVWVKLQDPLVIYRNNETQYESINGAKPTMVVKTFGRPLSEFTGTVMTEQGEVPRFKRI